MISEQRREWATGERSSNDSRGAIAVVLLAAALIAFLVYQLV